MFVLIGFILCVISLVPFLITVIRHGRGKLRDDTDRRRRYLVSCAAFGLFVFFIVIANIYLRTFVNQQWFESKGYPDVYRKILGTKFLWYFLGFGVSWIFLFLSFKWSFWNTAAFKDGYLTLPLATVVSLLLAIWPEQLWNTVLLFQNQVESAAVDPIFGKTLGFYMFSMPFYRNLAWYFAVLVLIALIAGGIACVAGAKIRHGHRAEKSVNGRIEKSYTNLYPQLFLLGALLAVLAIIGTWLAVYRMLIASQGVFVGAGYTDTHAGLANLRFSQWVYGIVAVFLLACAIPPVRKVIFMKVKGEKSRLSRLKTITVIALPLAALFFSGIFGPVLQQQVKVKPNEIVVERPYIEYNMRFTREAYGITADLIEESEVRVGNRISRDVLENNRETLDNIRLWDYTALLSYLGEKQTTRLYYGFQDVDLDRYTVDGRLREVMLSVRELDQSLLDARSQTWVNRMLTYTHGYGGALTLVNEFLPGGGPDLLIKNVPPEISSDSLKLERPEIYYGEAAINPIITNTAQEEFDYPAGENNAKTTYAGNGGIRLESLWQRFMFAWYFGSVDILVSPLLSGESRLHMNRTLQQMLNALTPFLKYDSDPYAVFSSRTSWICDAYTTSSNYPYSDFYNGNVRELNGINYIRNAVKAVVDAYDGSVGFYVFSEDDPILTAYRKVFPTLFKPAAEMPKELQAHLRYPEEMFTVQLEEYGTYHMSDVEIFYSKEDKWDMARKREGEASIVLEPYYLLMELPKEEKAEFMLISPYTPKDKNTMNAWMAARCDPPNYGKLVVFKFLKGTEILGPKLFDSRIDQDNRMSQTLTLWDQGGSSVLRGNLLVLPLFHKGLAYLMYVEPIFLQSAQTKIPEIKKIVLADQEAITWADGFEEALRSLVAGTTTGGEPTSAVGGMPKDSSIGDVVGQLKTAFDNYVELSGQKKFQSAGAELEKIELLLQQLMNQAK
jgi:uncharacterized membrane protein (UPF0182 family)